MKYLITMLCCCACCFSIGQGVVSEQADANQVYAKLGKPQTFNPPFFSPARYLNVGRNSLQTSFVLSGTENLRLNMMGGDVEIGNELNRPSVSGDVDLLPFAYGVIYGNSIASSTGNFTIVAQNDYTTIRFNDTSVNTCGMTIVVTPRSWASGEFVIKNTPQVLVDCFETQEDYEADIWIYTGNGSLFQSSTARNFSFVAYRN